MYFPVNLRSLSKPNTLSYYFVNIIPVLRLGLISRKNFASFIGILCGGSHAIHPGSQVGSKDQIRGLKGVVDGRIWGFWDFLNSVANRERIENTVPTVE